MTNDRSFKNVLRKILLAVIAVILIVVGLIVLPMPVPLGAIMIVTGLALMVSQSPSAAKQLRAFRQKNKNTNAIIQRIEDALPKWLHDRFKNSDP
ncbi:MAG: PGPGW domain-containing protein [Pseudomonadota bacterium]